ncbi:ferritin-like domain-containing protein [Halococcus qingdaonensis]|uniref:ferritin-like domain-containing protein n=1 Tax=Halococcus qingdaonensis TaxID=224402 RepID=UPI0021162BE5|nr:ferritin-like domain-containing protein [Halococcus qingdaonensis]
MTDDTTPSNGRDLLQFIGRIDESIRSRRSFMSDAAKTGVAASALTTLGAGTVAANDGNDSNGSGGSDWNPSDVEILNYALTLEHLEAAYYNDFLDQYSEHEVERSEVANYFDRETLQYSVYQQIQDTRDHEEAHVEALTKTIKDLGGTPVEPADYEFPYSSITEFVAVADRLEAVGVSAYAGAAPLIDSEDVLEAALSIHSVEANHQTYFQLLHLQRPAPNAFNPARTRDQVLPIAKQFIVGAGDSGGGDAEVIEQSNVQLAGENEVPPVDTDATGEATLELVEGSDGPKLQYELSVQNIENVTAAHIHLGNEGENGPVVAFLFGPKESGVSEDGQLASGTITESDLVGPLEGESAQELRSMTEKGAYVNVHTTQNPDGEIRGQIRVE